MEQIVIEVEDKEEFKSALNNAILAYNIIKGEFDFFLYDEVPYPFTKLIDKWGEEAAGELINKRYELLMSVYNKL